MSREGKDEPRKFLPDKQLSDAGLYIATGKQLQQRLKEMDKLTEVIHRKVEGKTSKEKIESLIAKVRDTDKLIRIIGVAWLSAGSDRRVARSIHGYEKLFFYAIRHCQLMLNDLEGRDPVEQQGIAFLTETWINRWFFRNALWLKDMSFFDKHVTPTSDKTIVVHTTQIGRGQGIDLNKEADKL